MFTLHGSPMSNYYCIVKMALMEKGLDFSEVMCPPSQDEDFLAISPMGKIPVLQVREGYISETQVIVEFLEDIYPEIPLLPEDPYQKSQARRICHMAELYLDLAIRSVLSTLIQGGTPSDAQISLCKTELERGFQGIIRVAKPAPWLAGENLSLADIFTYYALSLVDFICSRYLATSVDEQLPQLLEWRNMVSELDFIKQIDDEKDAALSQFFNRDS